MAAATPSEAVTPGLAAQSAPDPVLATFLVRHGDDNLIAAQRLAALVSWMPELEEDIAIANRCLDHLGQARALFQYAADLLDDARTEDDLAMGRDERDFTNAVLVEQPNGDFAGTMARQFFLDAFQLPLYRALADSPDQRLAGIAAKGAKEAQYHLRHSSAWVIRLGDGTEESHRRMQQAVDALWPFTADLFHTDEVDGALVAADLVPDIAVLRPTYDATVAEVLAEATILMPDDPYQRLGGRTGFHTEHLGHLLPEMQQLYRTHPGTSW